MSADTPFSPRAPLTLPSLTLTTPAATCLGTILIQLVHQIDIERRGKRSRQEEICTLEENEREGGPSRAAGINGGGQVGWVEPREVPLTFETKL
ncbi:hypothetical protein Nepgr_006321 [Nepenthes gracilis]|uniref:Uncharacterized protein n=1 Tax=Nepenthes gracilis TaxID=150966 RepID=A0AAD3XH86_NEPGR|nr:hypothetical protein Nepgr_006321 [Nepenthes gracilis]